MVHVLKKAVRTRLGVSCKEGVTTVVTVVYLSLPVRIQQKVTLDDGEPRTLEVRCVSEMCFIALEVQETS